MKSEDILLVLRLTAMGRAGHPLQVEFAEKMAQLIETPQERAEREMAHLPSEPPAPPVPDDTMGVLEVGELTPTPKKRKKAD